MKKFPFVIPFLLWMLLLSLLLFKIKGFSKEKAVFQTRAGSCGGGVPAAAAGGVDSLQQKINAAKNGETINLESGTYMGPNAVPLGLGEAIFVSASRGASSTCMIRIENKTLTLKGQGSGATVIYGEGHARPYQDPYQNRGGICLINSNVTIDGVTLKEFQKRTAVVYDSAITIKNSIIEGSDEGGISLLGNSSGLFVNNFFQAFNFGGIMLWQNSQAKAVNNIFNGANIMFFFHPGTPDSANAEIINNIFSGGSKIVQVDWWKDEAAKLQKIKASYNLFDPDSSKCTPPLEYCTDFQGRLSGDPLFQEPVGDMCGVAAWGNFTLKEGSPALGVGDPKIPGTRTLGNAGGPCVEPNSSICSQFIQQNAPKKPASYLEEQQKKKDEAVQQLENQNSSSETNQSDNGAPTIPEVDNGVNQFYKTTSEVGPQKTLSNNVFSKEPSTLYVETSGENKTVRILGIQFQKQNQVIGKELSSGQAMKYQYGKFCSGFSLRVQAGLFYQSSDDNFTAVRYKNIDLDCSNTEIVSIE